MTKTEGGKIFIAYIANRTLLFHCKPDSHGVISTVNVAVSTQETGAKYYVQYGIIIFAIHLWMCWTEAQKQNV